MPLCTLPDARNRFAIECIAWKTKSAPYSTYALKLCGKCKGIAKLPVIVWQTTAGKKGVLHRQFLQLSAEPEIKRHYTHVYTESLQVTNEHRNNKTALACKQQH